MIPLSWYVMLSAGLFTIGVVGVLSRRNIFIILMSIELMLNAANLALVAFGQRHVVVLHRHDLRQHLDQRHLRAEGVEEIRELYADGAGADDHEGFRLRLRGQRLARGHDARIAQVKRARQRGLAADGNDRLVKRDELLAGGGLDAQDVRAEVRRNVAAFRECGGYIVANSHHCIANIRGENIVAMCEAAHNAV